MSGYLFAEMNELPELGVYRINLDRRWKLDDLSEYTKAFEQSYYAAFALEALKADGVLPPAVRRSVLSQMSKYPWKGGYSTVNFYFGIKRLFGRRRQPNIVEMKYTSPGWLDLSLYQEIALSIAGTVTVLTGSVAAFNRTYNSINRGIREREMNKINVEKAQLELDAEKVVFLRRSLEEMAKIQGLTNQDMQVLVDAAGNEFRALKILQSIYRRMRVLANYEEENKAQLTKRDTD